MSNHVDITFYRRLGTIVVRISDDFESNSVDFDLAEFAYMRNDDAALLRYLVENTPNARGMLEAALDNGDMVRAHTKGGQLEFEKTDIETAIGKPRRSRLRLPEVAGRPAASLSIQRTASGKPFAEVLGQDGDGKVFSVRRMLSPKDAELATKDAEEFLRRFFIANAAACRIVDETCRLLHAPLVFRNAPAADRRIVVGSKIREICRKAKNIAIVSIVRSPGGKSLKIYVFAKDGSASLEAPPSTVADLLKSPMRLLKALLADDACASILRRSAISDRSLCIDYMGSLREVDPAAVKAALDSKPMPRNIENPFVFSHNPARL